ncbi:MAG: aldo/keto reductase [Acidobacteriaceae bacterium]|nr:aldo/keto reductase [Acidobacteriaceae bacterium]
MTNRKLGSSSLEVSPICFGGNVFGWTADEQTSFRLLDAFVETGFNFIDTADVYSRWAHDGQGGQSETIIGKWLQRSGKRGKVVLATKVGMEMGPDSKGLSRAYIQRAIDDSLQRLQTEYVDLYQSHVDDTATPLEETLSTFSDLIRAGKIRAIGASNYTGQRLAEALAVSDANGLARYESLQPLYNLYDRAEYERDLEPVCAREHIGVIPYFSLASGFLTGKYKSEADLGDRARGSIVKKYLTERGARVIQALERVAQELSASPAQVAIAWLLARPSVTAPIASATTLEQLDTLLKAAELKLDRQSIELLDHASSEAMAAH